MIRKHRHSSLISKLSFIVASCLLLIGLVVYLASQYSNSEVYTTKSNEPILIAAEFYPDTFLPAVKTAENQQIDIDQPLKMGLVPHHLLASDQIARVVQAQSQIEPSTIILIGPNHFVHDGAPVTTASNTWDTKFGNLTANQEIIDLISSLDFVAKDTDLIAKEHSITGLSHFIAYFVPDTSLVPLVLDYDLTLAEIEKIADLLIPYADSSDTVLLAAIDFAHYKQSAEALENSSKVIELLQQRDYAKLLELDSAYTDSPEGLVLMQIIADQLGHGDLNLLDHYTAARYTENEYQETTSYVVGCW